MLTPDDLRGIAEALRCNAEALHDGHTLRGEWHDDDARREHDKLIAWAEALASTEPRVDAELRCLADIRAAVGDSGKMMQDELVECIKRLQVDAERYRWLADCCYRHTAHWGERWAIVIDGPAPKHGRGGVDAAVDAARQK